MTRTDPDEQARRIAAAALTADDPTGWFELLYAAAADGRAVVPWDRGAPQRLLVDWVRRRAVQGAGRRALVVGCGLGEDAELVAGLGFQTIAFDVSETAIQIVRGRFPDSHVLYLTADLLAPPAHWWESFDLVVECLTVQSLPEPPRRRAIANVAGMVAPGGTLLVIAAAREPHDVPPAPPWPLTRAEIDAFATGDLELVRLEAIDERWRAELRRAG